MPFYPVLKILQICKIGEVHVLSRKKLNGNFLGFMDLILSSEIAI